MKALLALLPLVLLVGCGTEGAPKLKPKEKDPRPIIRVEDPVGLVEAPDKSAAFVLQEGGKIFKTEGERITTWLDLSSRVGEGGFGALAFSPLWESDRLFYVFFQNRGGALVLLEGAEEGGGGAVRRTVFRFYDQAASPGPMTFDGRNLLVGIRGEPSRKGWPGSLLRIEPFLQTGKAYSVPRGNVDGEVWRRGFADITSLSLSDSWLWITSGKKLLRTPLADPRPSGEEVTLPCLRGGAPWLNTFYYGSSCTGELFSWPSGKEVGSLEGLRGLVRTSSRVLLLGEDGVYKLPGEK